MSTQFDVTDVKPKLNLSNLLSKQPLRLAMNLLVKNEVDIIAENIRAHSQLGVDCFVIIDNGSDDGTWEKLQALQQDYELHLIRRPVLDYQQTKWKTEMAFLSRDLLGADWSIANDADEFWIPESGSLKSVLSHRGSIVCCQRYNVLYSEQAFRAEEPFYTQTLRVQHPVFYPKQSKACEENLSIMLGKIQGKVMVNNNGLLKVRGGNHRARHLWARINKQNCSTIKVMHYPIRGREHFIKHIENRQNLLAKGVSQFGDHYKRWVKYYEQGRIDEELSRLVISGTDAEVLLKFGVLVHDNLAKEQLSRLL